MDFFFVMRTYTCEEQMNTLRGLLILDCTHVASRRRGHLVQCVAGGECAQDQRVVSTHAGEGLDLAVVLTQDCGRTAERQSDSDAQGHAAEL